MRQGTAPIGADFGVAASSLFVDEGRRPGHRSGQAFVVDPGALAGCESHLARVEGLLADMLRDDGVRLPGARRPV